jgi:hypothetical protein
MRIWKLRLTKIKKGLSPRWGRETSWTKMWSLLRRKKEKKMMQFKLLMESWRNCKTRSKATRLRLKSFRNLFISLRKISRNMVLKHHRPTPNIISASNRSNLRTTSSPSSRKRILKQRVAWNSSRISMKQSAQIVTFTPRTFLRLKKKLLSWRWSSEEWLSKYLSLRKRFR